jgi:hypothetical protein
MLCRRIIANLGNADLCRQYARDFDAIKLNSRFRA